MEIISATGTAIAAGTWFGNKLLGPTVTAMGEDLKQLYVKGRDKIIQNAITKTGNIDDGGKTNLRVTRDVLWNGSFSDEEICAEYFGGVLASSRTKDGKDDTGVFYLDIIKSLSSAQLHLHYIVYHSIHNLLLTTPEKQETNVGLNTDISKCKVFFSYIEVEKLGVNTALDLNALFSKGLTSEFRTGGHKVDEKTNVPFFSCTPTSLGVQVFMIANNKLGSWRNYPKETLTDFENVPLPQYFAFSIEELSKKLINS